MNFKAAKFVLSAPTFEKRPADVRKEIIFIGRSNVGKSSLLNALCDNRSLAFTSSKPGHTRLLNYFSLGDGNYFVDAPGYGYSKTSHDHTLHFGEMMEDYFKKATSSLKGVVFLLDSRREMNEEDLDLLGYLEELEYPVLLCMTKCDKLNQKEKALMEKRLRSVFDLSSSSITYTSIKDKRSLEKLSSLIVKLFD